MGTFGCVAATLDGLGLAADASDPPDYAILLSGQDYPLEPLAEIRDFLGARRGQSFMTHHRLPRPALSGEGGLRRFRRRRLRLGGWRRDLSDRWWARWAPAVTKIPGDLVAYQGSQWWMLERDLALYAGDFATRRLDVVEDFGRTVPPDVSFFQTVLLNSPLAGRVVNDAARFDVRVDAGVLDELDRRLLGAG